MVEGKDENKDKMQNNSKKALNFTILRTSLLTIFICVVAVFYCVLIVFCVSPTTAISISENMGWKGGELLGYQQIYNKSNNIEDLYNFTVASINAGRNKQTLKCIAQLQERVDYNEFCEKMDISTRDSVPLEYVAYLGSVDAYLQNQKVVALFNSKQQSVAKQVAIEDLKRNNKYSFALDTYLSCLKNISNQALIDLANSTFQSHTILEWLDIKISTINYLEQPKPEQLVGVYTLLKINKVKYRFYVALENQEAVAQVQTQITNLQAKYANLLQNQ